jgi:type IV pilus assembly protein PilC
MPVSEFRFNGVGPSGQAVQGTVFAPSKRQAQRKVTELSSKHRFTLKELQQRRAFLYKVRHPNGKTITGEQKAYAQEEVKGALEKMGLEVIRVEKKLLNFQVKPPTQDLIMFVRLSANLLREKLPFDEILGLLINDISSKSLKQVLRDLNADLKSGMEAKQAFMKHQHMLGKFTAYMLGIASQSGNMAEIYESTARFMERKDEFRKNVRSAMITPALTIVALIGVMVWYLWTIIPQTAGLMADLGVELPYLSTKSLEFAGWMDTGWPLVLIVLVVSTASIFAFVRSERGSMFVHRNLIRVPVIGSLLHKLNIEVFCRVFSVLYSGAGDNIAVIKIAAEACGNKYMEHRIKTVTIPLMVARGVDLVKAMEASGVFTTMALARFRSGAETGNVKHSAEQMANYYEKETTLKLATTVETIQTFIAVFIALAIIFLTLVSSEIALVQPSAQDMQKGF